MMSVPVYQFMAKGCHRRAKTSVFHRICRKRFHDLRDRFPYIPVDKFVNYFLRTGLLCIFPDRRKVSIFIFQEIKKRETIIIAFW